MLKLIEITEEHTDFVLELNNSEKIASFFPRKNKITKEQHLSFIKKIKEKGDLYYIIYWNNFPVGTVSIYDIDLDSKKAEWGRFIIQDKYASLGALVEKKIIKIAFEELKLHKLYCQTLSHNIRTIELHKLLGFKLEGVLKDHILKDNKYFDIYFMGLYNDKE